MNITRRFLLRGAAAVAAVQTIKPVAAAMPPAPPPVPSWVPEGWLPCHGQSVSRKTYAKLFEVIGTTYGECDGETFVLPDLHSISEHTLAPTITLENVISTGGGSMPAGMVQHFAAKAPTA